ncbi:MAG: hypothetical protein NPINA01_24380 [Nitrospinaceae bacterium]|nr:MAG: hypothetical protein NPINA01_24380 [Nitrospinaceae bacterium]
MFLLDFGSLWIFAYLLLGMLNVIPSIGERAALAFASALGLKSLVLFCWMIGVGEFPSVFAQTGISLTGLVFAFALYRRRSANIMLPSPLNKSADVAVMVFVFGVLFILSLGFACSSPITEADGIWYHIKGMVFLHEGEFDSQTIIAQFRQYPPFLSLLFAYFMSFDVGNVKIIFPIIYLCLLVIFYYRVFSFTGNGKIATAFTLVLGTTPYFWWHSFLPFLDMTTGFYYSIGAMYWFLLIRSVCQQGRFDEPESNPYKLAFLSGALFGIASWSRLEFLLYNAIPLLLLIYVLDRNSAYSKKTKNRILICLAVPLLFFSTLWFLTLLSFDSVLDRRVVAVGLAGLGMVLVMLVFFKWDFNLKKTRLIGFASLAGILYLAMMVVGGPQSMSLGKALLIALIRSVSVHVFYLGTIFLVLFLFKENLKKLTASEKILGWFLVLYPLVHFLIFSYSEPKWTEIFKYIEVLWVRPGYSINLSDTRGMMAFYPILIFFIAGLPMVKKGFENE